MSRLAHRTAHRLVRRAALSLAAASLFVVSASANALGLTGTLDPVDVQLLALQGTAEDGSSDARLLSKLRTALTKKSVSKSVAKEAKAGFKIAKKTAEPFAAAGDLADALGTARMLHRGYADTAVVEMTALIEGDTLSGRKLKKTTKRRDKVVQLLADADADAAPDDVTRYKLVAKAIKKAGPFVGANRQSALFVMSSLVLSQDGADVDGDGDRDNALADAVDLASTLNPDLNVDETLAQLIGQSEVVTLIDVWSVDDFETDAFVFVGLTQGNDFDGDLSDNFSGGETFSVPLGNGFDADGHPTARLPTSIVRGGFEVTTDDLNIQNSPLPVQDAARFFLGADVTSSTLSGTIAFALPSDAFIEALADFGVEVPPTFAGLIANLADIDTDGDGEDDAISMAFDFTGVPAQADPISP